MNFTLTKEQELVRQMVRDFAVNEVKPIAAEIDVTERFPMENVKKMGELGMMGIPFPTEFGGAGGDVLSYILAVEELSKVCATTGVILSAHTSLCASLINENGASSTQYMNKDNVYDNIHSITVDGSDNYTYTGWTQGFKYTNNASTVTLSYTHYTGNDSSINIPVLNDGNTINQGSANASKAGIVTADQYNKIVSRLTYLENRCMWQSGLPNNKSTYIWSGTLAQFNSLASKPENTTFIISN